MCERVQMLLDKYVLTKGFESLLSFHNPSSEPHVPPASFVKRVNSTMTRMDPLLKTLQVRPSPPEGLVQAYLIHISDRSDSNFKKILELKGVRKQDQAHLMELFNIHREGPAYTDKLVQQSPLLTPLMASPSASGGAGSGANVGVGGLASINASAALSAAQQGAARFDAAALGEKLLNAARDGVERIGTPSAGAGAGSGSSIAAMGDKTTINENLKSIGKFFRRDLGGLGARFGKREGSVDETSR
jgi:vacuolar protein sorting-associated protein 53